MSKGSEVGTEDPILAIEASTEICSVALRFDGTTRYRESRESRAHAQALLPMVDDLLGEARISLKRVSALALGYGPGAFTGLRIAVSVVQGLAYGAQLPVHCISSLQALAFGSLDIDNVARSETLGHIIIPAFDARMGELYWAAYRHSDAGFEELCAPCLDDLPNFKAKIAGLERCGSGNPIVCSGSGWAVTEPQTDLVVDGAAYPRADALIEAIISKAFPITVYDSAADIEPLYLRNEIAWKKRERLRGAPIFS